MKANKVSNVIFSLLAVLLLAATASALPLTVNEIQLDDTPVSTASLNRLDVERDNRVEIEVRFTPTADIKNMEVQAYFSGYEYNDDTPLSDVTPLFDADVNVTYVKKLYIQLPDDVEEDDYLLRVIFSDRNGAETIQNFRIKLDVPRHSMDIKDVILSPDKRVKAGSALLATVRVENKGERDQDDVRVTVSIPQLGLSATDYIDEVENDDEEETEELYIRIPRCTKPGTYELATTVDFDDLHKQTTASTSIEVLGDETCDQGSTGTTGAKKSATVTLGATVQEATAGEGVIFPISIQNNGATSKTYTLSVSGLDSDLTAKVTPANTVVIDAGQTKTLYLFIAPRSDAATGMKAFTASVTSGTETVEQAALTVNVRKASRSAWDWITWLLQALLIALVVILVILAIVIGVRKAGRSGDETKPQAYY